MRKTKKVMLLAFVMMISVMSCNNEELFVEQVEEVIVDDKEDEEVGNGEDEAENEVDASLPCDFDLNDLEPNATVVINCTLDLDGQTINLPSGVTILHEGGDIINGTLNFSNNSIISGELLNTTLTLGGSNPQLKDPIFNFNPGRWGIVEGEVPQNIAYNNHLVLQSLVNQTKELGATTFSIDKMDAFFESANSGPIHKGTPVIRLPSDFHLKMSEKTILRVYPVPESILSSYILQVDGTNTTVSGGVLIGDRKQRDAIGGGNVTFEIKGAQNIVIDNVTMKFSSSAGLTINSVLFPGDPNYRASKNILVKNCTFDSNRANNLSITDGEDIIIENCKSYRAGNDINGSKGIAPRIGIVIEPAEGQRADRIIIRDNEIRDSASGTAVLAAWADDVVISGNRTDGSVGWTTASNVKVINNPDIGGAGGGYDGWPNTGGIISGNTINNASTGIYVTSDDMEVFDNTLNNCKVGIMLKSLKNSNIYNNTIISNVENGFGINAQTSLDNVLIRDNTVNISDGRAFLLEGVTSNAAIFKNNNFDCGNVGKLVYSSGFEFRENEFNTAGFGITSSTDILIDNNNMNTSISSPTFSINNYSSARDITVSNNTFNNTSSNRISSYGIKMNTVGSDYKIEDANILIQNNIIKTLGENYGIHLANFNGLTIENNTIINSGNNCCASSIYFRGNNSKIENNNIKKGIDIEGNNNIVGNNN